jgi:DNA-binding response OmpR family regulator
MMPPAARILVVEDDPDLRDALALLFRQEGYEVTVAGEGQEALDVLRGAMPPHLIVLDLMMPGMDGFEFRVQQMQDPRVAAIPVIVLSGGGDVERKAAPLDAAACFHKTIDMPTLLAAVTRGVARTRRSASRQRRRHAAHASRKRAARGAGGVS